MALILKDRVKESSSSSGTGNITLGGAFPGYQTFNTAVASGSTVYYTIHNLAAGFDTEWEVGVGTFTSPATLSRDTVLSSSTGSLINFTAGGNGLEVFITQPAEEAVYINQATGKVEAFGNGTNSISFTTITANNAVLSNGTVNATPSNGTDITNKTYVDTIASSGLHYHQAVNYERPNTDGNLAGTYADGGTTPTWTDITNNKEVATGSAHGLNPGDVIVFGSTTNGITAGTGYFVKSTPTSTSITLTLTYDGAEITSLTNGTGLSITSRANSGVGATLTNSGANVALVIDGVTVSNGNRILIYSQTNAYENGVYTVTDAGAPDSPGPGSAWVLTRAADADTYAPNSDNTLGQGDVFYVTGGNTGAGESYVLSTSGTIIFGTTNLVFAQISSAQVYSAGTGLNLANLTFSIANTAVTAAQYGNDGAVGQFTVNAQGQITNAANVAINASSITTGTLPNAQTTANSANGASTIVLRDSTGSFNANTITATTSNATTFNGTTGSFTNVSGNGSAISAINASNITSGTLDNARTTGNTANSANTIVLRDASGNFGSNVISASLFSGDGSAINAINASNISSGTIANARTTAASANGASTIVQRDAGGNFSANTITANISGDISGGTNINASNITSGTIGNAYTTANSSNGASTIVLRDAGGAFAAGAITGTSFSGNGAAITAINASAITTGTLDNARTSASSANGASTIVARDANGSFAGNTVTATTGSFTSVSGNGVALTAINASNISSGTVATARLASGTANSSTYLRGDSTWAALSAPNNGTLTMNTSGTGISGSATFTADQSGNSTFTVTSNANSANGASTIVARDSGGNFSANTITANLSGTATSAGSATTAVTVTGAAQANITSVGTLTSLTSSGTIQSTGTGVAQLRASGDISAVRSGGTTGVIFLNGADNRYLYYDGTNYIMPGGQLDVNGQRVLNAGNYNSYAPTLTGTGASGTWGINITGSAGSATTATTASTANALNSGNDYTVNNFYSNAWFRNNNSNTGLYNQTTTQHWSSNANGWWDASSTTSFSGIRLYSGGHVATIRGHLYADSNNIIGFLNTAGNWSWQVDNSGNGTATGNVTAYSDERLKKDWADLPSDFIEKLSKIKHGTYTRTDINQRQVGASAQDMQKILPEAVIVGTDEDKTLSLAYGNAALAACIELAKEVVKLREELDALKGK